MSRARAVFAGIILLFAAGGFAGAAEPPKLLAAGEWSKPVADADGRALRGRLVLCERRVAVGGRAHFPRRDQREVAVYVELQDAGDFVGRSMWLFCDLGKTDFRPEYKGGLHCQLLDKDKRPVPPAPFAFGGAVPASQWITLPTDATIRLRLSPFGISRPNALAISPQPSKLWVIAEDDANEYFLSGTFTIDPPNNLVAPAEEIPPGEAPHVWRGTIVLPAARIGGRPDAATSQPDAATTQPNSE
jgi:hypothetical protein